MLDTGSSRCLWSCAKVDDHTVVTDGFAFLYHSSSTAILVFELIYDEGVLNSNVKTVPLAQEQGRSNPTFGTKAACIRRNGMAETVNNSVCNRLGLSILMHVFTLKKSLTHFLGQLRMEY